MSERRKKILVVDDDHDIRLALRARLRSCGFDAVFAGDGDSALRTANAELPDLVLLDIGLPGEDGFQVLKRFRASELLAKIPVVILSAQDPLLAEERALRAGAAAFCRKPFAGADLVHSIEEILVARVA